MFMRRLLHSPSGRWLAALCGYALVVAPFGCEFQSLLTDTLGDDEVLTTATTGLFINDATDDSLLIAGRGDSGDTYFVYGTRDDDGNLTEIESVFVRQANGDESFITFESGRPVHAEAAGGSFAHIVYDEIGQTRLAATVELFDAAEHTSEFFSIEIDLERAAAEVAERVRELTGRLLEVPVVPESDTAKQRQRALSIGIFSGKFLLFVVPLVALVSLTVSLLGQVLGAIFETIAAVTQSLLMVVFSPLFLISELLNGTLVRVRFVGLGELFDALPSPPRAGGFS